MNVSAKTEYACIAVLELAARYGQTEPIRVRSIADAHGIPSRFLVQILLQLKTAGIVNSIRGAAGGYQLARDPGDVTLGEVMRVVEAASSEPASNAGIQTPTSAALMDVWREAYDQQRELLDSVTFAELAERARGRSEPMYYI
ncbi:MAG: Rrf2 family transcriptional regulator [Planctomycetales bacterium]|nr:Rrf2 family transcriptional regulator [Planctomycetales bacterium]